VARSQGRFPTSVASYRRGWEFSEVRLLSSNPQGRFNLNGDAGALIPANPLSGALSSDKLVWRNNGTQGSSAMFCCSGRAGRGSLEADEPSRFFQGRCHIRAPSLPFPLPKTIALLANSPSLQRTFRNKAGHLYHLPFLLHCCRVVRLP